MRSSFKERRKNSFSDKVFDRANILIMLMLLIIFSWPLWFVLIASISDPTEVILGNVLLFPKKITTLAYETLIQRKNIWIGFGNSIFYTVVGTVVNIVLSICCAYPLSRKDFVPRKFFLFMFMFTMYFSGGLIPTYLTVRDVGLLDSRWAMILPGAISVYNCLVMRTYFMNSIPGELQEAATLDGANTAQYLFKIVIPLSKPILAVIALFYGEAHWNDFYNALIYIYNEDLYPLQSILRDILTNANAMQTNLMGDPAVIEAQMKLSQTLKYSVIIVASVPMLCIYPFIQKFFVKGIMLGSVKG